MSALNLLQSIFGANIGGAQQMYQRRMNPSSVFKRKYHAYSPAYWNSENRDKLEAGDKIVLPASALEELSRTNVQWPIMFEIAHDSDILPKKSHCSVMEFTAPEGSVYCPIWMIDNLGLDPQGDSVVELTTVNLPKGTFVQFQAHETKFAMLSNPRVVLEKNLRAYSCLTVGDTIQIEFNNYIYKLDVTEVKPCIPRGTAPPAISIIETDIKVDFREPRDYKEWQKKNHSSNWNGSPKHSKNKPTGVADNKTNNDDNLDLDLDPDDNFGKILPVQNAQKSSKKNHFQTLKDIGSIGKKAKKTKNKTPKSKNQNKNGNIPSTPTNLYQQSSLDNTPNPYSSRGSPLGKKIKKNYGINSPLGNKGKCIYNKPKYVNGNMSMGKMIRKKSGIKKEEEIVGNMRYIYEIDQHGKRNLVRRLPVRNLPTSKTKAHSLK